MRFVGCSINWESGSLYAIEEHELDLIGKKYVASVPALNGKDWDISKEQAWSSFLENLEVYMGCNLLEEVWEGGMPARVDITLSLK